MEIRTDPLSALVKQQCLFRNIRYISQQYSGGSGVGEGYNNGAV